MISALDRAHGAISRAARGLGRLLAARADRSYALAAALFRGLETPIGIEPLLRREEPCALSHPYLHLGCGEVHLDRWCNVDLRPTPATDLLDDVRTLVRFRSGCADRIYACHVLDYLAREELVPALRRWHSLLRPGGELRVSVLDVSKLLGPGSTTAALDAALYGAQRHPFDFRKSCFTAASLRALLDAAGFRDVAAVPNEPPVASGVRDASTLTNEIGQPISATVMARKARHPRDTG